MMDNNILDNLYSHGEASLGKFFENQRQHLRRYISSRINTRIAARIDASDVIQEVYVRAFSGLGNYLKKPNVPPVVWIRQLSKQVLFEIHRRNFRSVRSPLQEVHNEFVEPFLSQIIDSADSIASEIHRNEMMKKIRETLLTLNAIDREVIEMRHMEGYSIREISDLLGLPQETVKKRYYRALSRFRSELS